MNDYSKYIDRTNALRYMGFKGSAPDHFLSVVGECEELLSESMTPRCVYIIRSVEEISDILVGEDIITHLSGCDTAVVFAATLGSKVDSLIQKYQMTDVTKALVIDAEASAATEMFCDEMTEKIASSVNGKLTPRFSPGYGDYPLEIQKDLLRLVDAERKIGLYAGESYMLSPCKSVTAVIGISDSSADKRITTCSACDMRYTCAFRKEDKLCEL